MTILKQFLVLSVSAKIYYPTILSTFFFFAMVGSCHSIIGQISGQTSQPRPVARLIGGPADATNRAISRHISVADSADLTTSTLVTAPTLDEASLIERSAFAATNQIRIKHGLAPLAWDRSLCRMARAHSREMGRNGFFSHQSSEGLGLKDRARASGIRHSKVLAENIAYNQGYDDPGSFAVERWMVSSLHRANILSSEFQASAIGSFVGPDERVYLTQVFISR
jgi:uncharacterized protein YkwD